MFHPSKFRRVGFIAICIVVVALGFTFWSWFYTTVRLNSARSIGVFPSPAEGMLSEIRLGWIGIQEARVVLASPENILGEWPHVWYVIACVWADSRADGSPVGSPTHDFDAPGWYLLDTHEGWVLMNEDSALFVGFWMRIFGLAGDDRPQVIHDPSISSTPMCVRQTNK